MAISFNKIFKKDQSKQQPEKIAEDPSLKAQTSESESDTDKSDKKGKHGEPGVCCGSCS